MGQVFRRVSDHPVLDGLGEDHLRDWRGEATMVPPRLVNYQLLPRYGPTIEWCGIRVPRAWRCGCWGNVASVLIEKPTRGDFFPIVDSGFSLQYSPLMEYREGTGIILFCQMDVTGRTEDEPAAMRLVDNMLRYVSTYTPAPRRTAVYVGDPAGRAHLEKTGMSMEAYQVEDVRSGVQPPNNERNGGDELTTDEVLVVGPGGGMSLLPHREAIAKWLRAGGHLLAIGLDEPEANAFLPFRVGMKSAEYICADFEPAGVASWQAGIGPADVHNRDPREIALVGEGVAPVGGGVLGVAVDANVVFCQLVPWQFDYEKQYNLKRTFRRTSFLVSRLLANMGASGTTPVLSRFSSPVGSGGANESRWLTGLYLDPPAEMDDPYRYFNW